MLSAISPSLKANRRHLFPRFSATKAECRSNHIGFAVPFDGEAQPG